MKVARVFMLACLVGTLWLASGGCEEDTASQTGGPEDMAGPSPESVLRDFDAEQSPTASAPLMPADLAGRLDLAIKALEAKDYKLIFNQFIHPAERARKNEAQPEDDSVKEIAAQAGPMLAKLREARTQRPTLSDNGTKATFGNGLRMVKEDDGTWYFAE